MKTETDNETDIETDNETELRTFRDMYTQYFTYNDSGSGMIGVEPYAILRGVVEDPMVQYSANEIDVDEVFYFRRNMINSPTFYNYRNLAKRALYSREFGCDAEHDWELDEEAWLLREEIVCRICQR